MSKRAIPLSAYLEAASVFHWADKRLYQLWFTGQAQTRHRRTESVLRRLTQKGNLRAVYFQGKLIYSIPRRAKGTIDDEFSGLSKVVHGLACTECLVRFFRSRTDGTVIAQRFFSSLGAVPEWGIVYPTGTMLLLEFCTKDNFLFTGKIVSKLAAYRNSLQSIEEHFSGRAMVVFVVDVGREMLKRFMDSRLKNEGPYYFSDYETFLKVPIGQALFEPIYIWSSDGEPYPLSQK